MNDTHVFVGDFNNSDIEIYDHSGEFVGEFPTSSIDSDFSQIDKNTDKFYLSFNNKIEVYDNSGTFIEDLGEKGLEDEQFQGINSIDTNSSKLFVVDNGNLRIKIYNLDFTSLSFIENNDDLIFEIDAVASNGTHFFIADSVWGNIRIFNIIGDHVGFFGERGTSTEEFTSISAMYSNTTHLLVLEDNKDSVMIFWHNGTYAGGFDSPSTGPGEFNLANSITMTSSHIVLFETNGADVLIFDLKGNYVTTISQIPNSELFENTSEVTSNETHLFVSEKTSDKIAIFDTLGNYEQSFNESNEEIMPEKLALFDNKLYLSDTGTNVSILHSNNGSVIFDSLNITKNSSIIISDLIADQNGFTVLFSNSSLVRFNFYQNSPSNLSANVIDESVFLSWDNPSVPIGANFIGINIYRSDVNVTSLSGLTTVLGTGYEDQPTSTGNYSYTITLEFEEGKTNRSNIISIFVSVSGDNPGENTDPDTTENPNDNNISTTPPQNEDPEESNQSDPTNNDELLIIIISSVTILIIITGFLVYKRKK